MYNYKSLSNPRQISWDNKTVWNRRFLLPGDGNQPEVSFTDNPEKRRVSGTFGGVVSRQSNDCAWHPATNSIAPHNREIKGSKRSDWGGVIRGRCGPARHHMTTVAEGMVTIRSGKVIITVTRLYRFLRVHCT